MAFADIYVIKKTRSKTLGIQFLDKFLPNREESSDEYLVPQYSDEPQIEFYKAEKLMEYLEKNLINEQNIYWRNLDGNNKNRHGMIFYTSDSCMIFGVSVDYIGLDNTKLEDECLAELKDFFETDEGYITYECPPVTTYSEFRAIIQNFEEDF